MADALVLFPHQLFESNAALARDRVVYLIEDELYFRQYAFHKQKLVLHRASMRMHEQFLRRRGRRTVYLDAAAAPDMAAAMQAVVHGQPHEIHYIDPVDDWLERRLHEAAGACGAKLVRHDTSMFLATLGFLHEHFDGRRRASMSSFYIAQRKALNVLVSDDRPVGGRWSFDTDNRQRFPKGRQAPALPLPATNPFVEEAKRYVDSHFPHNPGLAAEFRYAVTYEDARRWLHDFLTQRFAGFGPYEDAIVAGESVLFHSCLSHLLNTGLLTPDEVVRTALEHAGEHAVSINSLEGFIRQIIGWREYMRAAYIFKGRRQRSRNFWRHDRALPRSFWSAQTGIEPLDAVIARVLRHAYAHHIERLMLLANFMLLAEIDPDHVYRWFMELFIDAYDWVMVPNVYGMALYADGGLITTKPYVAGSNYIRKMSDFRRGAWCAAWDGLFWRFLHRHREFFRANARLGVLVQQLERMDHERLETHLRNAENLLAHTLVA